MKKYFVYVIIAIVMIATALHAQVHKNAQTTQPNYFDGHEKLPDFNEHPYKQAVTKEKHLSQLRPELGPMIAKLYYDSKKELEDVIVEIWVFYNPDGTPTYAEWVTLVEGERKRQVHYFFRGYLFKNGKFVFEQEKDLFRSY